MYWKYLYKIKIKTNSLLLQCTWSDIKFEFELYDYDKSHCLNLKLTSMMVYHHVVKVINLPRFDFRIIWKMYNNPRKELRAFASDTKKMSILYIYIYFCYISDLFRWEFKSKWPVTSNIILDSYFMEGVNLVSHILEISMVKIMFRTWCIRFSFEIIFIQII